MKVAKIHGFGKSARTDLPTKILLVMRLTAVFMLAACLEVQAHGYSQGKFTLSEKDAPIPKIFQAIERQSEYHFFYDYPIFEQAGKVSVEVKNASIDQVLEMCFKDQPFTYSIEGNLILVKRKAEAAPANAPPTIITEFKGRVTNEAGEPLQGATIEVQNAKKGTFTDTRGMFTLKNIPSDAVLEISFTGYQKTTAKVAGTGALNIVLKVATNSLDQVQIIAYGTTTQRLGTGDVTTISSKEIEEQPVNNPLLALEGRVPGMFIAESNGLPGSTVSVQIRGQNSILNGNDPLYIVDGVPYSSELLPSINSGILGTSSAANIAGNVNGNPLSFINPLDIESIEILKDADATAIYGSRAANGAVLITTKKGKPGHMKVDVNVRNGWGNVTRTLSVLNTPQYLTMRHEAINNDGLATGTGDYDINGTWDTTRYTNWQKTLIGGTSHYNDIQSTFSGGNDNSQYLIGMGYHNETTVFPGDFGDQKVSLHFNTQNYSSNRKLEFQLTGNYLYDNNKLQQTDLTGVALSLPPDAPNPLNPDGSLNWAPPANSDFSTWPSLQNPLSFLYQTFNRKTNNLISNATLGYHFFKGLEIKINGGYSYMQVNDITTDPFIAIDPPLQQYSQRFSDFSNNNISSWILEPQLIFKRNVGQGVFDALVGSTFNEINSNGSVLQGSGYNSDLDLENIAAAATVLVNSTVASVYKYNALFGRLSYNWRDKYLVNLTERRDGSSRFGPANEFHDFGAVGLGWIISKEKFVEDHLSFLSFAKIRGSYGTTGNDQIGDYQYMDLYQPYGVVNPYQGVAVLQINNLFNPKLQWEETKKMEGAVDLGFLKDRILVTASMYKNHSSNELLQNLLPGITGFGSITANLPATVENTGFELVLNTVNVKSKTFKWSSSFNLTIPRNKLTAFPGLANSAYANTFIIGQPITITRVYHFKGVNDTTGVYQFQGMQGNVSSTPNPQTDLLANINMAPKFYGGLGNSIIYKGFQVDFLFQFVNHIARNTTLGFAPEPGIAFTNQPTTVLSRWQQPGDHTNIQRFNSDYSYSSEFDNAELSDAAYSDASYIRLKNLSISWELAQGWEKALRIQSCKFYAQAQNLLTITKYKGLDPETGISSNVPTLPPLRIVTFGVQASF